MKVKEDNLNVNFGGVNYVLTQTLAKNRLAGSDVKR
jgi:hypothetical protein